MTEARQSEKRRHQMRLQNGFAARDGVVVHGARVADSAQIRRHFLTWDAPLLPEAARWLARDWKKDGPLDLKEWLVVVPTRQAGRRLRAALAAHAAEHGQAVFPPRVVPPEALLAGEAAKHAAPPLENLLAWIEVFATANLADVRALFPVDPPTRSFAWALRLASDFVRLQSTLAEADLALEDVATRVPADFPERARWECIGELAQRHARVLSRLELREPQLCRRRDAHAPTLPENVTRVAVVAVADPPPLALIALQQLAARVPVDVVIGAPSVEAENFDSWGRPRAEAWLRREPPFSNFNEQVHLASDAQAQAERIAELAARYAQPDGTLGVAIVDAEITTVAAGALARAGRAAFDPAGEPYGASGFGQFLARLADFVREATFAHAHALARTPEIFAWLRAERRGDFNAEHWLAALDDLHCTHLPATLAQAQRFARGGIEAARDDARRRVAELVAHGLELLAELRARLRDGDFATATAATLARVFAARQLDLARAEDRAFAEAAQAWSDVVRECAVAAGAFSQLSRAEWWEVALLRFGQQTRETEKPPGAIELQGWLELPWENAPHVVVAGFNEGRVPESITGDVFLPESLRVMLGLKTNAARFARDAFLLHALVASRRGGGRVDILLGKNSAAGDPLRPSRLLLQSAEADLPGRVQHLFRALPAAATFPAWERAWPLRPRRAAPPTRMSPTAFRSYLACPLRFYLRHVLKMEAVDPEKCELDAFDFGTLCHGPLEKFAEEPWRDCTDERVLAAMLVEEFDRIAAARFGAAPAVPLVAQLESARQRLRWAAKVQAQERAAGWITVAKERPFQIELGGLIISGKIDRIDRHETTGEWRVLDYKTSDTAKLPVDAHLGPVRDGAEEWAVTAATGKPRGWIDLQLPLYVHALPLLLPEVKGRARCAYFNLPKAATATSVAMWDDYTHELHESALQCAEAVIAAVRAEKFWPPNEKIDPEFDPFAELFHRTVADSVAWEEKS